MKHFFAIYYLWLFYLYLQFHRGLMIAALILQCIAFAFIFIQAGDFKTCSYVCTSDVRKLQYYAVLTYSHPLYHVTHLGLRIESTYNFRGNLYSSCFNPGTVCDYVITFLLLIIMLLP